MQLNPNPEQQQAHHSTTWRTEIAVLEITGNNQGMNCSLTLFLVKAKEIYSSAAFCLSALKTEEACLLNHLTVSATNILA